MKIYVSSTFEDLKEHRREVYQQLRKLRIDAVAMEDYAAGEKRPLAKCLEDVAEADIYVGIFAWRYGYVPKEAANPESRSITELEYRAAGEHEKERLIFLLREDAQWTPGLMDSFTGEGDGGKRIKEFRDDLATSHGVGFFATPDELAREVSAAVANVLLRRLAQVRVGDERPQATPSGGDDRDQGVLFTWYAYRRGLDVARSIGRIEDLAGRGWATGFLVAGNDLHPRLGTDLYLLTPAHVIAREKTQQSFGMTVDEARFRLTVPDDSQPLFRLAAVEWSSPVDDLDLSIIRLDTSPDSVRGLRVASALPLLGAVPSVLDARFGITTEPRVILAGHRLGAGLSFTLGGKLLEYDETQLQYRADTEAGSGGSPVMNEVWEVIGVHRLRGDIPRLNGDGRWHACQGVSLPAVRQALVAHYG